MSTEYEQRMARCKELFTRYEQTPQGGGHSDLNDELTWLENALLDTPPPGKRKGLIEHSGALVKCPGLADVFSTIREADWPDRIAEQDAARLRPFIWATLDQDGVGSCASEGICGAVMCRRSVSGRPQVKLSPWAVYGRVNGGYDGGSSLDANLKYMMTYGAPSQDVWPRSKGWRTPPDSQAVANAKRHTILEVARIRNKEEFGSALIYGLPVYFGYSGHAIFAADPIDRERFRYKNSWGAWGDDGFGTLSYSSVMWGYGAWAILDVTAPSDEV